jgi:hypothetical protein
VERLVDYGVRVLGQVFDESHEQRPQRQRHEPPRLD